LKALIGLALVPITAKTTRLPLE